MLGVSGTAPKLKAYAAEVRGLVPIALAMAQTKLVDDDYVDSTAKQAMTDLAACYNELPAGGSTTALADRSRRFATLYVTLEDT
eukprot:863158-Lingulodinium_polyedra.AAC.1